MPPPYQAFVSVLFVTDAESGSTAKRLMSARKVGTCGLRGCHTKDNAQALYFCPPFGLIPFLPLDDIVFARVSVRVPRMTETLHAAFSNKSPSEKDSRSSNDPSSLSHGSSQNPLSGCSSRCSHLIETNLSHNSLCHSKRKDSKSSRCCCCCLEDDAFNENERDARRLEMRSQGGRQREDAEAWM